MRLKKEREKRLNCYSWQSYISSRGRGKRLTGVGKLEQHENKSGQVTIDNEEQADVEQFAQLLQL